MTTLRIQSVGNHLFDGGLVHLCTHRSQLRERIALHASATVATTPKTFPPQQPQSAQQGSAWPVRQHDYTRTAHGERLALQHRTGGDERTSTVGLSHVPLSIRAARVARHRPHHEESSRNQVRAQTQILHERHLPRETSAQKQGNAKVKHRDLCTIPRKQHRRHEGEQVSLHQEDVPSLQVSGGHEHHPSPSKLHADTISQEAPQIPEHSKPTHAQQLVHTGEGFIGAPIEEQVCKFVREHGEVGQPVTAPKH
mmetsp:Transcript_5195/g.14653  ORF Transcript_5195/g.14653 Transcript_5195/m.14653 type:complete len:253 (-) Transcript_5195:2-760(-)